MEQTLPIRDKSGPKYFEPAQISLRSRSRSFGSILTPDWLSNKTEVEQRSNRKSRAPNNLPLFGSIRLFPTQSIHRGKFFRNYILMRMKISPDRHFAPIKASADCRFIFLRFPLSQNARKRIIILSEHNHISKVLISKYGDF